MKKNHKYRIRPVYKYSSWIVVEEKTWYGWKIVADFSVIAYGAELAIRKAKNFVKEVSSL